MWNQTVPYGDESERFRALREAAGLTVLVGPAGSGKTTFVHRFIRHLAEQPRFDHRTVFYFDCNTSLRGFRMKSFLDSEEDSVDGILGRSLRSRFLASASEQRAFLDWVSTQIRQSDSQGASPYGGWWREYLQSFSLTFGDDLPVMQRLFDSIAEGGKESLERSSALHSFYEHASSPAFAALYLRYARDCTAEAPLYLVFDNVDALPNEWQVRVFDMVHALLQRSPSDTRALIAMREENLARPALLETAGHRLQMSVLAPGFHNADDRLEPGADARVSFQERVLRRTVDRVFTEVLGTERDWPQGEIGLARRYIYDWLAAFSRNRASDVFNHNLRYQTEFLFRAIHYSLAASKETGQNAETADQSNAVAALDASFLYWIGYHAWPETPKEQWPWLGTEHPGEEIGILMHLVLAWLNNRMQSPRGRGVSSVQFAELSREFHQLGVLHEDLRRAFWQLYNFGPRRGTLLDVRRSTSSGLVEKVDDLADADHVWLRPSGKAFLTGLVSRFQFLAGQIDYKEGRGPHPDIWAFGGTVVGVLEHASRLNEAEATLVARLRRSQSMSATACSEWYLSRFGVKGELPSGRLSQSIGTYLMRLPGERLSGIGREFIQGSQQRLHAALVGIPLSSLEWSPPAWADRLAEFQDPGGIQ